MQCIAFDSHKHYTWRWCRTGMGSNGSSFVLQFLGSEVNDVRARSYAVSAFWL